jgi:pimeloyl-ACP methyl ester carboxylesterase
MHGDHATRVVLVPGAAGAAAFWTPITKRLPDDWIVTAIDLPGLGSVPARDGIHGYDDLAEYVAAIVAAPSTVVAQSMGAYVALRVALRYPHLVTHLVLVAATSGIDVMKCGAIDWRSDYSGTYPQAQSWACDRVPDLSADLLAQLAGDEIPLRGVFIRAPRIRDVGDGVDVLGELDGEPVLVRDGRLLLASFHPELTDDLRVHELFLQMVEEASRVRA